jgi:hypothetical protein
MNTNLVTFPLMLALTIGCSTALAERAPAVPGSPVGTHELSQAAACLVTGPSHTIASHARVQPGIQVASSTNKLVLRVPTKLNEAVEMDMDPASSVTTPAAVREPAACASHLENARTFPADPSFAVGTSQGKIALSTCGSDRVETLWNVSGEPVRDLQVVAIGHDGFAIAYRQENTVWMGKLDSEKSPVGPLTKIAEKAHLRWLTLAESNGSVLLVWAEREAGVEQWSLGAASSPKAGALKTSHLELPGGGIGGDVLQPALAGIEGDHFLLAWTEGNPWSHQVRAAMVDAAGAPIGPAFSISDRTDGGWAQVALTPEGHGAVVFMTPVEGGFAAVATPVTCGANAPEESVALAALHR